jgi:hypothetical protein
VCAFDLLGTRRHPHSLLFESQGLSLFEALSQVQMCALLLYAADQVSSVVSRSETSFQYWPRLHYMSRGFKWSSV